MKTPVQCSSDHEVLREALIGVLGDLQETADQKLIRMDARLQELERILQKAPHLRSHIEARLATIRPELEANIDYWREAKGRLVWKIAQLRDGAPLEEGYDEYDEEE